MGLSILAALHRRNFVALVTTFASISLSGYLYTKPYYRDPVVLREYRNYFMEKGVVAAVQKYGVVNLQKFLSNAEITSKVRNLLKSS